VVHPGLEPPCNQLPFLLVMSESGYKSKKIKKSFYRNLSIHQLPVPTKILHPYNIK
jgi:hypothetical protein